jgi:hypothetical protein
VITSEVSRVHLAPPFWDPPARNRATRARADVQRAILFAVVYKRSEIYCFLRLMLFNGLTQPIKAWESTDRDQTAGTVVFCLQPLSAV